MAFSVEDFHDLLNSLSDAFSRIEGDLLEMRYEKYAPAHFARLARRVRVVDRGALAERLDEAEYQGRITNAERDAIMRADLILSGQSGPNRIPTYFVVELSAGVGIRDVTRAIARAAALEKLGQASAPVVAGRRINAEAESYARSSGVAQVIEAKDGLPDLA